MENIVIGLGITGLSCVRFLKSLGHAVVVMDTRLNPPGLPTLRTEFPDVEVELGGLNAERLGRARSCIVSPGVSLKEPAIQFCIQQGVMVMGDIELFARVAEAPIIAITGSNGKSTVTALVGELIKAAGLRVAVGGNIGTPALDLLSAQAIVPDYYVLELSSFQLETTYSLCPKIGVILNISADHLDRYDSLQEYIAAKQRIYHGCEFLLMNRDQPITHKKRDITGIVYTFGEKSPTAESLEYGLITTPESTYLAQGEQKLFDVKDLRIKGRHNWMNALVALAMGRLLQLPMTDISRGLRDFPGLPHRCQWVMQSSGVDWYNDSKGTNVGASLAAIEGLGEAMLDKGKLILIAGGRGKSADFAPLRMPIQQYVRTVILMGEDADKIAAILPELPTLRADSLEQAILFARQNAQSGDAVLLSPACASFDMFDHFVHRGEQFMFLVKRLAA